MEQFRKYVQDFQLEIIEELFILTEPTLIKLQHAISLFDELSIIVKKYDNDINGRKDLILSLGNTCFKSEIFLYCCTIAGPFHKLLFWLQHECNSLHWYLIPVNFLVNSTNVDHHCLYPISNFRYRYNSISITDKPYWTFDICIDTNLIDSNETLPFAVDVVSQSFYLFCKTTTIGLHHFDLKTQRVNGIYPLKVKPSAIYADEVHIYILIFSVQDNRNRIEKLDQNSKTVLKTWTDRSRVCLFGLEFDGNENLYSLRGNSLCVFKKNTLAQIREYNLGNSKNSFSKAKSFAISMNQIYVLPENAYFEVFIYSASSGYYMRKISLGIQHYFDLLAVSSKENIFCSFNSADFIFNFNRNGETLNKFSLSDTKHRIVSLHYLHPNLFVLCIILSNLRIVIY